MSTEQTKQSDQPPPYPGNQAPYPAPYPAGQAPYPPPQQQYPPMQQQYPPAQTNVYATVQNPAPPVTTTVVTVAGRGNCPNCRVGTLVEEFTCCGIVLAIIFFPLGLLCCLLMRVRVCTHCHAAF